MICAYFPNVFFLLARLFLQMKRLAMFFSVNTVRLPPFLNYYMAKRKGDNIDRKMTLIIIFINT